MELDLNRDIIEGLIDKAREFNERDDVTPFEDESEPEIDDVEWAGQMTDRYGEDPVYQQFKSMIEDLEPDQQITIVALMWIGRGDYSIEEWEDACEYAMDAWTDHTADYLIGTPLLAEYLGEALDQVDREDE